MNFILSDTQARKLEELVFKIRMGTATKRDIDRYQFLVRRTNYNIDRDFRNYLAHHGHYDVNGFLADYRNKKNAEFVDGLVKIGLGILAAYALYKLSKK